MKYTTIDFEEVEAGILNNVTLDEIIEVFTDEEMFKGEYADSVPEIIEAIKKLEEGQYYRFPHYDFVVMANKGEVKE